MSWNSRNSPLRPASLHWLLHVHKEIGPKTLTSYSEAHSELRIGAVSSTHLHRAVSLTAFVPTTQQSSRSSEGDAAWLFFFSVLGELTPSWLFKHHLAKPKTWNLLVLSFLLELSLCEELLFALLSWALTLRSTARRPFFPRTLTKRAGWVLIESTRPAVSLGVTAAWMDGGHDVAVKSRAPLSTVTPWIASIRILRVQMKLEKVFVCFVVVQVQMWASLLAAVDGFSLCLFFVCLPDAC